MRLIDADALVAEFKQLSLGENSLIERIFADGVYAVIETAPTVDAVPVGQYETMKAERDSWKESCNSWKEAFAEYNKKDLVEVVRCKDCKHCMLWREPSEKAIGYCRFRYMYSDYPKFHIVKADDFCSYGERKIDGEDL